MKEYFSIGETARLNNISIQTLRLLMIRLEFSSLNVQTGITAIDITMLNSSFIWIL